MNDPALRPRRGPRKRPNGYFVSMHAALIACIDLGDHAVLEDRYSWAMHEACERMNRAQGRDWDSHRAAKPHECTRGCQIQTGEIYFKYQFGVGWHLVRRFCWSCAAMIFAFSGTEKMPPVWYTHWSSKTGEPVCIPPGQRIT
jgi:hypothetical protein